jgi:hypothetical protein
LAIIGNVSYLGGDYRYMYLTEVQEAVVGIIAEQVAKIAPKPKIIDPDEEPPGIGVVFKLVLVIPFL